MTLGRDLKQWVSNLQAGVSKAKAGLGIGVSTLYTEDEVIDDCDKTLFDWLKEDNTEKVVWLLREKGVDVNRKDAEVKR